MAEPVRTRVNLFRNASTELGTSGIWRAGTGTGATVTRDTTKARSGAASARIGNLTASTTLGETRWLTVAESTQGSTLRWATYVNPSQTWDFVPLWEGIVSSTGAYAGGNGIALGPRVTCPAGQWTRIAGALTLAADRTANRLGVLAVGNPPIGFGINTDDGIAVLNDDLPAYFDGSSPRSVDTLTGHSLTHEWAATPHDSNSIQKAYAQEPQSFLAYTARSGWRYFATRLQGDGTEVLLDPDLPLEDVTIDQLLSGHNALSARLEPVYSRLLGPDGEPLFIEYSTAIYAENDGDIRGGGILTHSGFDGPSWEIEATGFTGYAVDLPYTDGGYKGIRVDPLDVVRVIWNHIQSQPGGNIGLEIDTTNTGGAVSIGTELKQVEFDSKSGPISFESGPYKLNWYSNHDLAADIDNLASDTPFDFTEHHSWRKDGTIRHFMKIGYPKIGRRREDLRFVHGVNIFDPVVLERSGELYASGTMVLGAGEGAGMIKSLREPAKRPGGRLRRIAVVMDDTIKSKRRAEARADAENQWRARLNDVDSVVVRDHPNAALGAVGLGDEIRIEGQGDWIGIDMWVRVLGISYQPANGQIAEYTIARTDKLMS